MNSLNNNKITLTLDGWIKEFLIKQKEGLTGNIENALEPYISYSWDKYPLDEINKMDPLWKWVPFEQTAYWLDGAATLAKLLNDKDLYDKTSKIIYNVITNADEDGYLGPSFLKEANRCNRWPFAVFARACIATYYHNQDINIIKALEKHYLSCKVFYFKGRNVVNIETMLLVYEITKNKELLNLAIETYKLYQEDTNKDPTYCSNHTLASSLNSKEKPYEHGVTYNEIAKLGAILYIYTNNKEYLLPTINAYKKLCKYHLLPDGLHSSNEYLNGKDSTQTHETCNVSDFTWSLLYLLKATKNGKYADLIENCIYNAGIGSVMEDFKALQYFSVVNQVVLTKQSNHGFYRKGSDWMCYKPGHETQCCAGNVNRFFPNFISNMYMQNKDDIYAIFYGKNKAEFTIKKQLVVINEDSDYPFDDTISFKFSSNKNIEFNLHLRIPTWSKDFKVYVNDKQIINIKKVKGFIKLKCNSNDSIKLFIPSNIEVKEYNHTGVIVKKGAILYALGMKGNRKAISYSSYPMYEITPNDSFNYGINIENAMPKYIKTNSNNNPFDFDSVYSKIEINAYQIPSFKIINKEKIMTTNSAFNKPKFILHGNFNFTPKVKSYKSEGLKAKRIVLYPFASCKLRLGILPKIIK